MKFDDIEDKLELLEITISLLGFSMERSLDYFGSEDGWLDSYLIVNSAVVYEINFFLNNGLEIKYVEVTLCCRSTLTWDCLKSVDEPTEDQIDEVITCLIANIGVG